MNFNNEDKISQVDVFFNCIQKKNSFYLVRESAVTMFGFPDP